MLCGKNPLLSFLKLTGCEEICRAYGVIVDEAKNCVYFLMELLEGNTLMDLLEDKTPIGIPFAVNYTINILRGLQFIHSKGMVHSDIIGVNIMIIGPKAILIDTTGARTASSPNSLGYVRDVENAIKLLNNMLHNDTVFSPRPWKASEASDQDRNKFNKKTLKKLEHLLKRQAKYLASKSPKIDKIVTLLKDLQEIYEELRGFRPPPDSPQSSEDEAESQKLELAETQKRLEEQDKLLEDFKRVNKDRDELKAKNKNLAEELDTFKAEAEQKIKDLQDQLEALKAQMQGTAGKDEVPES